MKLKPSEYITIILTLPFFIMFGIGVLITEGIRKIGELLDNNLS